jgi:phosphatidylglycerol:prolipoprotein diacylglycerol transferase
MVPTLSLLGVSVRTYPLFVLLAAWIGLWWLSFEARQLSIDSDRVYNLGFYALLSTLLGARLVYALSHLPAYWRAPLSILSLTPTGLSWPGGVLIGGIVAAIYWRRSRLPVGATLDAIAPTVALSLALERVGAFLGGSGYGQPTSLPWGVHLLDAVRHPVQLYEAALLLIGMGILLWRRGRRPYDGHSFALYVALYAASRLLTEAYRAQTPLIGNSVRAVQVVALIVMLGAVGYLYRRQFATTVNPSLSDPEIVEE